MENRIVEIIMMEITKDNLVIQEKLERAINKKDSIEENISASKKLLEELVINELMINKFKSLIDSAKKTN